MQQLRAAPLSVELPEEDWNYSERLLRQLDVCHERDWRHAAALLEDRLRRGLERCSERFQEINRQVAGRSSPLFVQRPRDIFDDLVSLADEFEGVSVDGQNRSVSVTTESIVLEEINLGPFEIRLQWDRIGDRRPYRVIASHPNSAGESSETTHPHVKGEQLCEGDGRMAIDRALRAGRLLDFFQLVSRILETYNPGGVVALSEWNGSPCSDCGDVAAEEGQYTCDRCGDRLCRDCLSSCCRCEGSAASLAPTSAASARNRFARAANRPARTAIGRFAAHVFQKPASVKSARRNTMHTMSMRMKTNARPWKPRRLSVTPGDADPQPASAAVTV